jgi:Tol biopolymer transport system component
MILFCSSAASANPAGSDGPVCSISQITRFTDGSSSRPFISGRGTRIAFLSNANPTGGNPGNLIDVFLTDTTTGTIRQLTTGAGSAAPFSEDLAIDTNGTHVAFASTANPTGENGDGNREIFVVATDTGAFTQITKTSGGGSDSPAINGDGTRLAFRTNTNVAGTNPNGANQIVLFDAAAATFTKIATVELPLGPAISGDGSRIAFLARDDLTGENPNGDSELFLFDTGSGLLSQITRSGSGGLPIAPDEPSLSFDGTRIAFRSTGDFTGDNPERNAEMFLFDTTSGMFTQLSNDGAGQFTSMNAAGTRVAFRAGDPSGNSEVFLADTTTNVVSQLTTSGFQRFSLWPSIDGSGDRIAFVSQGDLTGENADGLGQVFLATCGVVNAHLSLTTVESTFRTSSDTTGCPADVIGTFTLVANLTALPSSPPLRNLRLQVQKLTNDNLLQNADFGPARVAATLTLPMTGGYTDGVLNPGEGVDVPFVICLQDRNPFQLFVDVLGELP